MTTQQKNVFYIVLGALAVLLIPLIAMQFTSAVKWGWGDFVFAFVLLVGTGLTYEFGVKRLKSKTARYIAGGGVALLFLLIWAQAAVGIL